MPISVETIQEYEVTVFKGEGRVPFGEQMDMLKTFYAGTPTKHVIWDFTLVNDINITTDELHQLVKYTKDNAAKRPAGRTALIADTKLKYGLGKMASTFAELAQTAWTIQVFTDMDSAISWISAPQ